jgi:hypothetical protein
VAVHVVSRLDVHVPEGPAAHRGRPFPARGRSATPDFDARTHPDDAGIRHAPRCYTEAGHPVTRIGVPCRDRLAFDEPPTMAQVPAIVDPFIA